MYLYTVATLVGIYCILTLGLNTITGIAGQISLGHAAFLGIGAYTAAILTVSYGWDFWPALIAAVVAAGGAGALVGAAAIRVREDFLAITTMGVNFVVVAVFLYFPFSITILCMLVLGGIGTNRGAIAGAVILGVLPELSRPLADYRMLTYGALLLVLMRWAPHGLLGDASLLGRALARRRA